MLKRLDSDPTGDDRAPQTLGAPESLRYVARQPILDARGNVFGYELLYRKGSTSAAFDGDGDSATRNVLDNAVIFGMERLTGGLPMFVNCTQEALLGGLVKVLPPAYTVLELLETLEPNEGLFRACMDLKASGFQIALDDFQWKPAWKPLFDMADYVKVDLASTKPEQRAALKKMIGKRSTQMILERVETQSELAQARREGFTLFQGFYFCRPETMENREVPPNRMVLLEILEAAMQTPLNVKKMSDLVKREPSLTYRLLRMANSPIFGTRMVVNSIHAALVMIGDEMFRRVALLAATAELKGNRPSELLRMAFLRGRFCELAAPRVGQDPTEQYLIGLLSLLPAMLSVPMESVVRSLPLRREVHDALLGQTNAERTLLGWIEFYELGDWDRCDQVLKTARLEEIDMPELYSEAVVWAEVNVSLAGA